MSHTRDLRGHLLHTVTFLVVSPKQSQKSEANLTKLYREIEHNKKVCRAQELGSYAQGQGHNQVKGQIVPEIVLLINY